MSSRNLKPYPDLAYAQRPEILDTEEIAETPIRCLQTLLETLFVVLLRVHHVKML